MEEQTPQQCHGSESGTKAQVESKSLFDCFGKKHHEEKTEDDVAMTETVSEVIEKKEEKHTLMDELQRSQSNSSSSSDDEGEEGEKKSKKKKGSGEKFQEKLSGGNEENVVVDERKNTLEIQIENENADIANVEETGKKENLPGDGVKEKKGILEKIKEMIPGQCKSNEDEIKEKEN